MQKSESTRSTGCTPARSPLARIGITLQPLEWPFELTSSHAQKHAGGTHTCNILHTGAGRTKKMKPWLQWLTHLRWVQQPRPPAAALMMQFLFKREAQHIGLAGRCTLRRAVLMCCTSGDELCPADKRPASIQRRLIWALSGSVALLRSLSAALSRSGGRNQLSLASATPQHRPVRSQAAFAKLTLTAGANDEWCCALVNKGTERFSKTEVVGCVFKLFGECLRFYSIRFISTRRLLPQQHRGESPTACKWANMYSWGFNDNTRRKN